MSVRERITKEKHKDKYDEQTVLEIKETDFLVSLFKIHFKQCLKKNHDFEAFYLYNLSVSHSLLFLY